MFLVSWCRAGGSVGTPVRWELWGGGLLNTGQGSVGGPGRPAAIFSLAVSNETAQGPRKKGLLPGHPALPEITPETRPTKEAFRGRSDTGTWHQILNLQVCFADKWKFPLPSPSQSERLGERNERQGVGWRSGGGLGGFNHTVSATHNPQPSAPCPLCLGTVVKMEISDTLSNHSGSNYRY